MLSEEAVSQIRGLMPLYMVESDLKDTFMALVSIKGLNENTTIGFRNCPNYLKPIAEEAQTKFTCVGINCDREYSELSICLTLEVLLYGLACECWDTAPYAPVTGNIYSLLKLDAEANNGNIEDYPFDIIKADTVEDLAYYILCYKYGKDDAELIVTGSYQVEEDFEDMFEGDEEDAKEESEEVEEPNELEEDEQKDTVVSNENTTKDSTDENREDLSKWKSLLQLSVNNVLNTMSRMYKGGYDLFKPRGVLVPTGIVGEDYDPFLESAFLLILASIRGSNKESIFQYSSNEMLSVKDYYTGCRYFAQYHLRNTMGVSKGNSDFMQKFPEGVHNWTELRPYVERELLILFREVLVREGVRLQAGAGAVANAKLKPIINALKTCIIVDEVDEHGALKFKVSLPEGYTISKSNIENTLKSGTTVFDSSAYVDRCVSASGIDGVYYITVVYSKELYENTPLFAFQVLDALEKNGIKPTWRNVILGRRLDDTIYIRSFEANTECCTMIIADQRSGKGVLTLNICASALGCGATLFYIDCKPDMSVSLQNIVKQYGREMFAFDGTTSILKKDGKYILPEHHWGILGQLWDTDSIPKSLRETLFKSEESRVGFSNAVCYIRSIQMLTELISLRAGGNYEKYGGDRVVVVIDELEKFDRELTRLIKDMYERMQEECLSLSKEEKLANEVYKYYRSFTSWCGGVLSRFATLFNAHLGLSRTSIFIIFQKCEPLLVGYVDGIKMGRDGIQVKSDYGFVFKYLGSALRTGSARIVGNGTGKSGGGNDLYGCASSSIDSSIRDVINSFGFIDSVSRGSSISNSSVPFKPYFVLNDTKGQCINDLYARCSINREQLDAIIKDGSKVPLKDGYREDIAFLGYAKRLLGKSESEIVDLLSSGWDLAEELVMQMGYSDGLQYFLYDLHTFDNVEIESPETSSEGSDGFEMSKAQRDWINGEDLEGNEEQPKRSKTEQQYVNTATQGNIAKTQTEYTDSDIEDINVSLMRNIENMINSEEFQSSEENNVFNNQRDNLKSESGTVNIKDRGMRVEEYKEDIFKNSKYNSEDIEFFDEHSTTECLKKLSEILYSVIDTQIGQERVFSVIEKDRFLIVNDVVISPSVDTSIIEKLPYDLRSKVSDGRFADVFCFGLTRHFKNLSELVYTDSRYFIYKITSDYGISRSSKQNIEVAVKSIFKLHKNLGSITIGNYTMTLEDFNSPKRKKLDALNERLGTDNRSIEIDNAVKDRYEEQSRWGIENFYRSANISKGVKVATTVGVGALAIFACTNPIGLMTVGYVGGKTVVSGGKKLGRKLKNGFKSFASAFKDSL